RDVPSPAPAIGTTHPVVGRRRQDDGLGTVAHAKAQALKDVAVDQRIASTGESLRVRPALQEGLRAAEPEATHVGLVRATLDVESGAPVVAEIEFAVGEKVSAKLVDRRDRLVVPIGLVCVGAAGVDLDIAVAPPLAIFAQNRRA